MPRTLLILMTIFIGLPAVAAQPRFESLLDLPDSGVLAIPVSDAMTLPSQLGKESIEALLAGAAAAGFNGESGEAATLYATGGFDTVLLVGTGDESIDAVGFEAIGGRLATLAGTEHDTLAIAISDLHGVETAASHVALGALLGGYKFDRYKSTEESKGAPNLLLFSPSPRGNADHWDSQSRNIAAGVVFTRNLISEPANVIYPESFVERTRAAFAGLKNIRLRVLDEKDIESAGMGALWGVGMGSARPPRLLIVEYNGAGSAEPVVFAGKGVTFDSGGISIKRADGMWKMKYDMSGAAAVTGTLLTLAKREAAVNAIAIAALVENMPSQRAQRPGDVRVTGSGKTIEIINTDAEGRLILADAVWYAQEKYDPALLVDVATLTGSVRTALGTVYAGLFTRHDELAEQFLGSGKTSGEEVWRLPLHKKFVEQIKSPIADIKNTGVRAEGGGASVGAEVIGTFVNEDTPWVHLDIASTAWAFKAQPTVPVGAAGWGVRLLNQLVMDHYEQ